ncbi:MAG TPA: hypothetical protein VMR20_11850 [Verrucomicrobiae bacterium]|nr:hypothetical protein [Verrucomicrobiae bacterium]
MSRHWKSANPKITIVPSAGADQTVNCLFQARDELEWLLAIGLNRERDIYFYDTGGDIIEDMGILEYVKDRLLKRNFCEPSRRKPVK